MNFDMFVKEAASMANERKLFFLLLLQLSRPLTADDVG